MSTIFTKIIAGDIPCHRVYEDDNTIAFMDIRPIQPGAVVVVPKVEVDHVFDLDDLHYQALMLAVREVAQRLRRAYPQKARVGVIIEGFEVAHAHVKVFPVDSGNEVRQLPPEALADDAELAAAAERIRSA